MSVRLRPGCSCHLGERGLLAVELGEGFKGERSNSVSYQVFGREVGVGSFPLERLFGDVDRVLRRRRRVRVGFGARHSCVVKERESSATPLHHASPVALLIAFLVEAEPESIVENVTRAGSSPRNK